MTTYFFIFYFLRPFKVLRRQHRFAQRRSNGLELVAFYASIEVCCAELQACIDARNSQIAWQMNIEYSVDVLQGLMRRQLEFTISSFMSSVNVQLLISNKRVGNEVQLLHMASLMLLCWWRIQDHFNATETQGFVAVPHAGILRGMRRTSRIEVEVTDIFKGVKFCRFSRDAERDDEPCDY